MHQTQQLAHRFREVLFSGSWVANTNLKEQVDSTDWKVATAKVGNLNTIATLTFHLHYYIAGVLKVLQGGPLEIRDKYSFDFPQVTSQEDWESRLLHLWRDVELFADLVEQMPDRQLNEPFTDVKYGDYQRNLDGMIEHCYYHFGQIVLLKKMQRDMH